MWLLKSGKKKSLLNVRAQYMQGFKVVESLQKYSRKHLRAFMSLVPKEQQYKANKSFYYQDSSNRYFSHAFKL